MAHALAPRKMPYLDGLRALLLAWVMFVHSPEGVVPEALQTIHKYWGFGVDGFLAISGFLVTRSLQRSGTAREFLARRAARIFPPYFATLALVAALALATRGGLYQQLAATWRGCLGFPLFFANYAIPADSWHIPYVLQPYWSMSFQEQCYLLLAGASLAWGSRQELVRPLLAAGLGSIALRLALALTVWRGQYRGWEYQANLHLALDSVTWGCLAWLKYDELGALWKTRARAWLANSAILGSLALVIAIRSWWHTDLSIAILACFKAPLLALLVRLLCEYGDRFPGKALSWAPLALVGRISYEAYLLHAILYGVLEKLPWAQGARFYLIAYPTVWMAGWAFHRGFGLPAQRWLKGAALTAHAEPARG
jgi:peptidoglycan/LPS O-acetylase OafA/YrhL